MRMELQALRNAARASVVSVAGWQPRAVQRRFEREASMDPLPAEARVVQITQELGDLRQCIQTLTRCCATLDAERARVERERDAVDGQFNQMHALMHSTIRLLKDQ